MAAAGSDTPHAEAQLGCSEMTTGFAALCLKGKPFVT